MARKQTRRSSSPSASSRGSSWVRHEIVVRKGRGLRVLIYARYSTEEQNARSISDQVAYCKSFLESLGIAGATITILSDEAISGEIISRPGIDQVTRQLEDRQCDLLLVEDASRLYRNATACGELCETAVDNDVRVICINDYVDTADENWDDRLNEAARHHQKSNQYTSRRIKRALEALWAMGAAIGLPRPGYIRRPTVAATQREPEQGPFYDEIDPQWLPVVYEAFERIASHEPPEFTGAWLEERGLPKTANAQVDGWTPENVISLIRATIYRGLETYRVTTTRKILRTGKRRAQQNDHDAVLTRESPHLRIVPDWLSDQANDAIDARCTRSQYASGSEHPLFNIARDQRGPLAGVLVCGICGHRMQMAGRAEGGYRCGRAHGRAATCWNRATTLRDLAHKKIGQEIIEQLPTAKQHLLNAVIQVHDLLARDGQRQEKLTELENAERRLLDTIERLMAAVETTDDLPERLVEQMLSREAELAGIRADREHLVEESAAVLTERQVCESLEAFAAKLQQMDRGTASALQQIVGTIRAVPYQQFGSGKVVLMARFEIQIGRFLPYGVQSYLRTLHGEEALTSELGTIPIEVELFDRSPGPKHGLRAAELAASGLTRKQVAAALKLPQHKADDAIEYGRKMLEANVAQPFTELKEAPPAASRWRTGQKKQQ